MNEFEAARSESPSLEFTGAQAGQQDCSGRIPRQRAATLIVVASSTDGVRRWRCALNTKFSVCEATDRNALELVVTGRQPDVLVIDLALPRLRRDRGLRALQRLSPATRIIVLTGAYTEDEGLRVLKAGAKGYCARTIEPEDLSKAVAAVLDGEIWVSRKLFRALVAELIALADRGDKGSPQREPDPRLQHLTERQRLVSLLVSRGASNKEISNRLNISERTVKAHITEAFRNVGVSDRLQLALLLQGISSAAGND